ncbi:hypothetical protein ACFPM0_17880 [Pseudonocardia sulfidoxydans]|uniref:hypothetical protein n=1 Tax=Pseudonocardia sulfidoxydans TaxID=54011 RepID=UPI003610D569
MSPAPPRRAHDTSDTTRTTERVMGVDDERSRHARRRPPRERPACHHEVPPVARSACYLAGAGSVPSAGVAG